MTTATILIGRERRRRWTTSEKLRIVEESFAPGASPSYSAELEFELTGVAQSVELA